MALPPPPALLLWLVLFVAAAKMPLKAFYFSKDNYDQQSVDFMSVV